MEISSPPSYSVRQGHSHKTSESSGSELGVGLASGGGANLHISEKDLVENLVWIKSEPWASAVEEHLEKTIALAETRVDRNRTQIRRTQHEILQLFGLWSVLQVVLLSSVAISTALQCRNLWTPICLSLLISIITCSGVFPKYKAIRSLQYTLASESQALQVAVTQIYKLRREAQNYFEFCNKRADFLNPRAKPAVVPYVFVGLLLPLFMFSVVILISFWQILCYN